MQQQPAWIGAYAEAWWREHVINKRLALMHYPGCKEWRQSVLIGIVCGTPGVRLMAHVARRPAHLTQGIDNFSKLESTLKRILRLALSLPQGVGHMRCRLRSCWQTQESAAWLTTLQQRTCVSDEMSRAGSVLTEAVMA